MKLPKSYADISVKEYIQLKRILRKEYDNPFTKTIETLSVFNDKDIVMKNTPKSLAKIMATMDFILKEPQTRLKQFFKINGTRYGIVNHIDDLDAGQYISIVTILKDLSKTPDLHIDKLHEILACVIFPVNRRQRVRDLAPNYYRKLTDDIYNHMNIADAYPIAVFFCNLSRILTEDTQDYLRRKSERELTKAKGMMKEVLTDLQTTGDGLPPSTLSAMVTLQNDLTTKI